MRRQPHREWATRHRGQSEKLSSDAQVSVK
jgi:hypothetical protein